MAAESPALSTRPTDLQLMLREFQGEATLAVLPAVYAAGIVVFALSGRFRDPYGGAVACLLLCSLAVAVWALHRWNDLVSAWALVIGCLLVDLIVANWAGFGPAVFLLVLPAGLAALSVSVTGGVAFALGCTFLLTLAPHGLLPADGGLRSMTATGIWGAVGLIWLTRRHLWTALQWSWSSHQQSRRLLEQARDYRLQFKQMVADLADANLHLTRLNRLAQALRQAAEEARQAKEQFVANVSHELRTPLNMIVGYSEMIVRAPQIYGNRIPPALLADLAVILRNSEHLSSLIDDVLDLSQIEAVKMALTKERVAFTEIVEAAATAVRSLFTNKGLRLDIEVAEGLPPVLCDRTRIREVVLNLLSNAGRFASRGGVRVRAWQEADDIMVSVADTGPGIPKQAADRIFQPFQQLDGSTRRQYGGTGLGLAISKSFVELHGGRMWVESEMGAGATFCFRLPIDSPQPLDDGVSRWFNPYLHYQERTRRSLAPATVVRPRFVLLETSGSLQRLLTRYQDGVEVAVATSLEQAVEELARIPAQALLINHASVSDTLQRLGQSVALPHDTPVIICSVPGTYEAATALAVSGYLVKPVSGEALLGALNGLAPKGNTVLIVDDEPEAARLFQRMLALADPGYRVLRASSGREALRILREQHVDVMLLDLIMPDMDGFQLLEARSQDLRLRDIPVVIISARDPAGQPIVASALAVTRSGGLSVPQLLACIEAISRILSPGAQSAGQAPTERPPE